MEDFKEELTSFNLANDDDEVEEEEVTERDEYVDGEEEEYYDEEYPEEEEYYDEEYPEEEYAEEEYPEEEYDDRLNQVLDELAELKRGMNAPSVVPPPTSYPLTHSPSVPYVYTNNVPQNPGGNEVVMYNEISRLRDELSKTQNSQNLHVELSRLREDMAKESKQNESAFLNEIKRLNEKIETLEEPKKKAVPASNIGAAVSGISDEEFNKLLTVCEAILKSNKDSENKIVNEVAHLKGKLSSLSQIEEAAKNFKNNPDADKTMQQIVSDISDLKRALKESGIMPTDNGNGKVAEKIEALKSSLSNQEVDNSEILRQLYEIKAVLGNSSQASVKHNVAVLNLFNELNRLKYDLDSSENVSFGDKLNVIYKFVGKLENCQESDIGEIVSSIEKIIDEMKKTPLTRGIFDSIFNFSRQGNYISIPSDKRESVNRFLGLAGRATKEDISVIVDFLPDMILARNEIQGMANEMENEEIFSEIMSLNADLLFATDSNKITALTNEIFEKVKKLTTLTVGDVATFSPINVPKVFKNFKVDETQALFEKLNELCSKTITAQDGGAYANDVGSVAIMAEVKKLKNEIYALTNSEELQNGINDLRANFFSLSDKLESIAEEIASRPTNSTTVVAEDSVSGVNSAVLDDLVYIKDKLNEYEAYVSQIVDLRADILNTSDSSNPEQFEKLYTDVTTQIDKLYDDITAVYAESEERRTKEIEEIKAEIVKSDDSTESGALLDFVVNLRDEMDKFYQSSYDSTSLAAADRQKLLDDIGFIRSQIESEQAAAQEEPAEGEIVIDETLIYSELVDLKTKIEEDLKAIENMVTSYEVKTGEEIKTNNEALCQDLLEIKDKLNEQLLLSAAQPEGVSNEELLESVKTVREILDGLTQTSNSGIDEVLSIVNSLDGTLATTNTTILENHNMIMDELAALRDLIAPAISATEQTHELEETINTTSASNLDNQNAILDDLATIKEQHALESTVLAMEEAVNNANASYIENQKALLEELAQVKELISAEPQDGNEILTGEVLGLSEKLTNLEQSTIDSFNKIIEELEDVKEQIHLKELESNLSAVTASEEEQQTLIKEIADVRERLTGMESATRELNDSAIITLDNLTNTIEDIKTSLNETSDNTVSDTILVTLDEINQKLSSVNTEEDSLVEGNIQLILDDIVTIKEKVLTTPDGNEEVFNKILDDLNYLRNQVETSVNEEEGETNVDLTDSGELSNISEELSVIKEKLSTLEEYDTVAEILALREDVKSIRIIDQNDVTEELERVTNELNEIKQEIHDLTKIKDEITRYRTEVTTRSLDANTQSYGPTNDEVNVLLNEIVALRDEVQSYKDEMQNLVTGEIKTVENVENVTSDENFNTILDELTTIRDDLTALKTVVEEDKFLKLDSNEEANQSEVNATIDGAKAALLGEMQAFKDELYNLFSEKIGEIVSLNPEITNELNSIKEQITNDAKNQTILDELELLKNQVSDFQLAQAMNQVPVTEDGEGTVSAKAVIEEIRSLKNEISVMKEESENNDDNDKVLLNEMLSVRDELSSLISAMSSNKANEFETAFADIKNEMAALKEQIAVSMQPSESDTSVTLLSEVLSLRDELTSLRENQPKVDDSALREEIAILREEVMALRSEQSIAANAPDDTSINLLTEVMGLRDDIEKLKSSVSRTDSGLELLQTVDAIKQDVQVIKDEPDLSVINEVLALRDEFQGFKDELNKKNEAIGKMASDKPNSELIKEINSLRDQLFAISMASVNDGTNSEATYESYNNIILDEITALHEEVSQIKNGDKTRVLSDEISEIKSTVTNLAVDEREKLVKEMSELKKEIIAIKNADASDATNNAILLALANLKTELENQRDADATTINFMSEMAGLLERQNQYINQNASNKLSDEIESLKQEIASSRTSNSSIETSAIMNELAKLKTEISQNSGEAVVIDNQAIIDELVNLKEEFSREKPSAENLLILEEISRLKNEISNFTEKENKSNKEEDFSKSIHDLRDELSQIADFVSGEEDKKPSAKSQTKSKTTTNTPKKTTGKTGAKKTTTQAKATKTNQGTETKAESQKIAIDESVFRDEDEISVDELLSKINATSIEIPKDSGEFNGVMNIASSGKTSDDLDIASKLAKQVANKLIMEQLVQQLGDGGVSKSKIDEIVKDILPQEFSTIQMDEQSDQIRRLANSLVLDKLRSRLTGKKND